MARQDGTWTEYSEGEYGPVIERTFGSELKAMRSALEHGHRVTRLHYGETIREALEREERARKAATDATERKVSTRSRSAAHAETPEPEPVGDPDPVGE